MGTSVPEPVLLEDSTAGSPVDESVALEVELSNEPVLDTPVLPALVLDVPVLLDVVLLSVVLASSSVRAPPLTRVTVCVVCPYSPLVTNPHTGRALSACLALPTTTG